MSTGATGTMPSGPSGGSISMKDLHEKFRRFPEAAKGGPSNLSFSSLISDYICFPSTTNRKFSLFYGKNYLGPFLINTAPGEDATETCDISVPNTTNPTAKGTGLRYHNGSATEPVPGLTVYISYKGLNPTTGNTCTNILQPQGFYRINTGDVMHIGKVGDIRPLGITEC